MIAPRLGLQQAGFDGDPGGRSVSIPAPAVRGSGSPVATTTRATPARTNASLQGGVLPVWLQGSSVT
jgi:hypothetical protein